jgi:hypothetical protein
MTVNQCFEDLAQLGVINLKRDPEDKEHQYLIQFTELGKTWNEAFPPVNTIV